MSDVDIVLDIAVKNVDKVYNLSNALQQLNRAIDGSLNPMRNLDARSRALSSAIGSSDSSLKNHAKSVAELTRNNAVLTNELGRVRKEISGLGTSYRFASRASSDFKTIAVRDLKAYEESLKGIRVRALVEDLKSLSQEQKRLGKDAQFVGRSLIIGLTTPIMTFSRMGLQSLVAIDKEFVRLNKVLESVAPNIESAAKKMGVDLNSASKEQNKQLQTMVDKYNQLDKALTNTSTKFGMAKSLTVGLAGDFAELGIQTTENIALITELTAKTEKLGNMDVGAAKDLVQSLYFQAVRAMQQSGESVGMPFQERERKAIQAATAQLNLFNSVENVTALTLRDLGDAFPEVAAAATSFGLSMTEAAALLAPMKAAGFETGASANSIKVSLQRLTAPTKQNAEMFKELSKQYNVNFNAIKGTGLDAIQQLVDGFNTLKDSAAGQEGAMEFFAKVFGVRQGPRMEVAIAQMAEFDKLLKNDLIPATDSAEKRLQGYANSAIRSANRTTNANLPVINSFRDIGIVARIATATAGQQVEGLAKKVTQEQINAAKSVRTELSKEILKAQREGGEDLIGQVGTEAGRAMFIELAGTANAAGVAQRELEASLASLDTQLSILKNNFKMFTAELVKSLKPAIEKISEISTKLYNAWSGLDAQTKKLISTVALIAGGATAAIGPLIFVFGQFRLAMGSIGKVLFGFLPGLKTMTIEALAASEGMTRLTKPISMMGDTVVNTNGKFATFIATLASGDGPVGRMADRLGRMTGVLQQTSTAPLPVMRALKAQKGDGSLMPNVDPMLRGGSATPTPLRRLMRTGATGLIDPDDPTRILSGSERSRFRTEERLTKNMLGVSRTPRGMYAGRASGVFGSGFVPRSILDDETMSKIVFRRQEALKDAGVRTSATGERFFTTRYGGAGRITEDQATGLMRGGLRGRITRAGLESSAIKESVISGIKGAPSKAVDSYKAALDNARKAQKALQIESLAMGKGMPGTFASMKASVLGFAKSFGVVNNAIKLTKITLIASGIGIILLSIGVAVMLIMKNMDKFKKAGSEGIKVVGEAFKIVKNAAMELIRPIVDLFASFGSGAEGTEGAVSGLGNIFNALANVLKFVAQVFSWLVKTIIQPYLYIVINIVKFVISLFTGNWMDALKSLGAAFGGAFAMISKLVLELMGFLVKQVINLIFELPAAFAKAWAWGIEKATDLFFGFAEFVIKQVKRIPGIGRFLGNVGEGVLGGLKTARDAYVGTVRTVAKAVDGAGDFIKRGIDKGVNAAQKSVDKLAKGGVKKSKGKFDLFGGKDENSVDVDTDDAQEKIASASGDGMTEGAEEGSKELAKRAKQALKDLKREVQEEIADRIKNAMESVVDQIQDALKAQKEASLKVYDDQIKKIEDVAKSEGRLTKEMEYQNRLREAEAERSLNRMNSKRNYALAVYAGNIDEARVIADESARQEIADNQKIDDINKDRAKEIAEQNKADLIDSIKDAKQKASEYFDSMIKTFTDAAKKITEFPPTTAEEFNTMLNQLIEGGNGFIGAKTIANNMGTLFSQSFSGALSQLGVNASGPLTSSLEAIGKTLTDNNPFGENGIWNKTIDASIDALTRKYKGLTNTLTTVINTKTDAFKNLYETYKKYQDLVNPAEGTGGGTTGGAGGGTGGNGGFGKGFNSDGVKIGNKVAIAAASADLKKIKDYSDKYLETKYGNTAEGKRLVASIKGTVGSIASSAVLLGGHDAGMKDYMPVVLASKYRDQITTNSELVYAYIMNNRALFIKGSGAQGRTDERGRSGFFKGGMLPYMMGGATKGPTQQGIPALLHGGEYVVRNSAVKKYGWGMMQQINQGTYKPKPYANGGMIQDSSKDKKNLNYGNVLNDPNSLFMQSIEKWRKDNPDKVERDEKAKAMLWKQIAMGGRNLDFFDNIMLNETGYKVNKSTRPKLGDRSDIGWYNVGLGGRGGLSFNPMWNKSKINGKLVPDPTKGLSKSGGLQINAWAAYGGLQYAPFADQATPYEQMVIYNRKTLFGWQGGMQNGVKYPAKPGIEGGWLTHLYNKNISEKLLPTFFGNMQLYEDWNNYNGRLTANKNIKNIGKQVGGFERILLDNGTFQYYKKISSGKYEPVDKKDVKKGKYSYIHPFDVRNPEYSDGYAIGGLVKGKDKTSAGQFRKADIENMAKYKNIVKTGKKKNAFWRAMDSIEGGVNSAMNFGADMLQEVENIFVSNVHEPVVRFTESTINPLAQLLRIPGSENLEIASPGTAAYSAIETFLTLFGGKLFSPAISKIGQMASEGSSGPIRNVGSALLKKYFPDEIQLASLRNAKQASESVLESIVNGTKGPSKKKLSEIIGISPEKVLQRSSYPTEEAFFNAMDIYYKIETKMVKEAFSSNEYKIALQSVKKLDKAIALPRKIQSGLKFIQNGVLFSEFDDLVGSIVDFIPGLSNKPRNVANMPWAGGLDKILEAVYSPASSGGMFSKAYPESTTWYTRPAYESEFELDSRYIKDQNISTDSKDIYKDDQGKIYNSIFTSRYFYDDRKEFRASIPELFRKHKNTIIAASHIPKKDFITRNAFSEALGIFGKTVGLKTKIVDAPSRKPFDDQVEFLKFLGKREGLGLDVFYDYNPDGAIAWASPFDYNMTLSHYKENKVKPRMTAQLGVGMGALNKFYSALGLTQAAFPFKFDNITDLVMQLLTLPLKAIGPGNEGGLSDTANAVGLLTQAKGLLSYRRMLRTAFLHELGHNLFLEHTMNSGGGEQNNISGAPTAIRSIMSYNAPQHDRYLPGDIRGFQSMLKPLPDISKLPKPVENKFNGGLIQSFEKGGLVKGKDKTSAGQFRMFDSISDFDIQRITYNAEQQVKKGKKNIFQKIGGAIASPFKGAKNRLQKEMFGAMYGKGTGTTGSYADTYKGFAEATKDANIFNPRGLGDYEAPAGSIFANEALRQGMSMIRTVMDFTPSGGIMSAGNAADKNRSGLSRLGWALASYGAIAGNPTIFAPNSGYMGGAGKGIKGISNLQKTIQEASNVEQFFPGTRIPMPAGLRPTLSQETGAILNQIGANASLHRHTNNMGSDAWHVRQTTNNLMNIQDRYINIRDDITRSDAVREMARNAVLRMRGLDAAGIRSGSSAFRSPSFPVNDFIRTARSSGFADDQIFEALSKARIANDFDWYGYSDFDRFMDALYTGKVINRTLPRMSKYPPYFPPEILARRIQQAEIKENVLKNINISKSIRLAKIRGVVSGKEAQRALRDNMILEVEQSASGRAYTLHTWQRLKDGSFGNTSKFTFDIDDDFKALDVGYLQRGNSFASAMDLMKMLSYVYSDIMLPNGIKTINPGSTSVHSEAMVIKLKEVFKKFDPDIKFGSGYGGEWQPTSLNTIDFDNEPYLFHYENFMRNVLEANNVFLDPAVRLRTHTILKNLIDNSKGITGEAKSSIIDRIGGYANGGFVNAFASQGVPAILHGGEYVINSSAVKNLGISALQALNDMRFNTPKSPSYSGPVQPQSSSTSTVHIYVDNFIGEKQWFESMMKDYNINVAPQNQKAAGLNNTTISTYRGINRGL